MCRCAALSADEQRASEAAYFGRQAQRRTAGEGEGEAAGSVSAAELSRLGQFGRVPKSTPPPQGSSPLGEALLGAAAAAVERIGASMQAMGREVSEFSVYDDADRLARVLDDGLHGGLALVGGAAGTVRARVCVGGGALPEKKAIVRAEGENRARVKVRARAKVRVEDT